MNEREVFGLALGLAGTPWYVAEVTLDLTQQPGRLDLRLDFAPGSRFPRPSDGQLSPVYDTEERTWRHLNFFQFECYLHAWVPRVDGGEPDGVKTVAVPWARPRSGFTLLMEAMMVLLARGGMAVAEAARTVGEEQHRLWRVLHREVARAHAQTDLSGVRQLSVDETSVRRGHDYVTVVCEPKAPGGAAATRVLFVAEGRDAGAVTQAREFLAGRGVPAERIGEVCADMSVAYAKGVRENFPQARLVFDFFHVVQLLTTGVDAVRRRERERFPELLKGTRYLWLKHDQNLTEEQRLKRCRLLGLKKLQTGRAHCQLSAFQDLLAAESPADALAGLRWWYYWVTHSRVPEMIAVAKSIKRHWDGIVAYLETRLTNGPAEALNGIIQTAKRKARGFRTFECFRTIIYLIGSKLKFDLPVPIPLYPQQTS